MPGGSGNWEVGECRADDRRLPLCGRDGTWVLLGVQDKSGASGQAPTTEPWRSRQALSGRPAPDSDTSAALLLLTLLLVLLVLLVSLVLLLALLLALLQDDDGVSVQLAVTDHAGTQITEH